MSCAVHPQVPLPTVHVGFSQTFVRSGFAGGELDAGVAAGAEAGCCVEPSGERAGEVPAPPFFVVLAVAPEPRRDSEESVSAEQAVRRPEATRATAVR